MTLSLTSECQKVCLFDPPENLQESVPSQCLFGDVTKIAKSLILRPWRREKLLENDIHWGGADQMLLITLIISACWSVQSLIIVGQGKGFHCGEGLANEMVRMTRAKRMPQPPPSPSTKTFRGHRNPIPPPPNSLEDVEMGTSRSQRIGRKGGGPSC